MVKIKERKRLSSGEKSLDLMMGGGFVEGTTTLLSGAPGVGKTTLGMQFLESGIQAGEVGLFVTFEEFPSSLIRDAMGLGWDLKQMEKDGKLRLVFTSPEVFLGSLQEPNSPLSQTIRGMGPTRAVVDSATHFKRLSDDPIKLRDIYNTVVNALKREGITTLLLDEDANISKPRDGRMPPLPFVVDSVFLMRYVEVDSAISRALTILKMRGSQHDKSIRPYEIKQGGLKLLQPFKDIEGILTGVTRRVG
ncbi:MAG: ATPase domain-containing protein [Chloroflexota bacterium]